MVTTIGFLPNSTLIYYDVFLPRLSFFYLSINPNCTYAIYHSYPIGFSIFNLLYYILYQIQK